MRFIVNTWYDIVTPESASEGDYAECGVDDTETEYDTFAEALSAAKNHVGCYEMNGLKAGTAPMECYLSEVMYGVDPELDYQTGAESYPCACIKVQAN